MGGGGGGSIDESEMGLGSVLSVFSFVVEGCVWSGMESRILMGVAVELHNGLSVIVRDLLRKKSLGNFGF